MLNDEVMKWGCNFAEGFEHYTVKGKDVIGFPDGQWTYLDYTSELFQLIAYKLFIDEAIDGINSGKTFYNIRQEVSGVVVFNGKTGKATPFYVWENNNSYYNCREQALNHIYKEMKVN